MAEYLIRAHADAMQRSGMFDVSSAGAYAVAGRPASSEAVRVMAARGIDLSAHRSRQLTRQMIQAADLILVMEQGHASAITARVPDVEDKVMLFGQLTGSGADVEDPYGQPLDAYVATGELLATTVTAGWAQLLTVLGLEA